METVVIVSIVFAVIYLLACIVQIISFRKGENPFKAENKTRIIFIVLALLSIVLLIGHCVTFAKGLSPVIYALGGLSAVAMIASWILTYMGKKIAIAPMIAAWVLILIHAAIALM